MNPIQWWLLVMVGCFVVAGILQLTVMIKLWTTNINWLIPFVLAFYAGGVISLFGMIFTIAGRL